MQHMHEWCTTCVTTCSAEKSHQNSTSPTTLGVAKRPLTTQACLRAWPLHSAGLALLTNQRHLVNPTTKTNSSNSGQLAPRFHGLRRNSSVRVQQHNAFDEAPASCPTCSVSAGLPVTAAPHHLCSLKPTTRVWHVPVHRRAMPPAHA